MEVKVTVRYRNDEQGIENLEAAYRALAAMIVEHLREEEGVKEIEGGDIHQGE